MTITIITITFNAAATIEKALASVANQSYKNIEHIVVDGGSKDETLEICKKFSHLKKIVSEPDKGIYDAFNKGLKLATGDVVGFLNADDTFFDTESVTHIANGFASDTECVFGNLHYINEHGKILRRWKSRPFKKGNFKKHMPAHPTFYCKKECYDRLGGYDISYTIAGDFELMLRFLEKESVKSNYIDRNLIKMLAGGNSNSGIKSKITINKEELRAFRKNGIRMNYVKYFFSRILKAKQYF